MKVKNGKMNIISMTRYLQRDVFVLLYLLCHPRVLKYPKILTSIYRDRKFRQNVSEVRMDD